MSSIHLTEGEMEIMEVLWECERPMGFGELHKCVNDRTKRNWKKQTVNTLLFRIRQKNLAGDVSESGRRLYIPLITRNEYIKKISREFLFQNAHSLKRRRKGERGGKERAETYPGGMGERMRRHKMKKTQKTKKDFLCLLFILPSLAGMCFFYIVPFLSTLYYSLINNMADKKWGKMVLFFSADSADCTLRNHHCLLEIGFRKDRAYQQSVADGGK